MKNTKIVQYLRRLPKEELSKFEKFLKKECLFANKNLPIIFTHIRAFESNFDSKNFTKQTIYQRVYQKERFEKSDQKLLANNLWDLKKLLDDFLISLELERNETLRSKLLIQGLGRIGIQEAFQKEALTFIQKKEKQTAFDEADYLDLYQIKRDAFFHLSTNKLSQVETRLPEILKHLQCFHYLTILKYGLEILNRKNRIKEADNLPIAYQEIISIIKSKPENTLPVTINTYLKITDLYAKEDLNEVLFEEAKLFCETNFDQIATSERPTIFAYLRNFLKQRYFNTQLSAKKKLFQLLEFSLEKEVLLIDGFFPYARFINMVLLAVDFKEIAWINNFVKTYGEIIQPDFKEDTLNYINCYLLYVQGNYDEASKASNILNFKQAGINFIFRSLMIRTKYELAKIDKNSISVLESYLNACRRYFHRNNVLGKQKEESYKNFVEMTQKLVKYRFYKKTAPSQKNIENLKKRLNKYQYLTLKDWLAKQILELELP